MNTGIFLPSILWDLGSCPALAIFWATLQRRVAVTKYREAWYRPADPVVSVFVLGGGGWGIGTERRSRGDHLFASQFNL